MNYLPQSPTASSKILKRAGALLFIRLYLVYSGRRYPSVGRGRRGIASGPTTDSQPVRSPSDARIRSTASPSSRLFAAAPCAGTGPPAAPPIRPRHLGNARCALGRPTATNPAHPLWSQGSALGRPSPDRRTGPADTRCIGRLAARRILRSAEHPRRIDSPAAHWRAGAPLGPDRTDDQRPPTGADHPPLSAPQDL